MSKTDRELLEEVAEVVNENNTILRQMRSHARWRNLFSLIKWLVIIGVTVGAYYYLEPYIKELILVYQGLQEGVNAIKNVSTPNLPDIPNLADFLNR